MYVNGFSSTKWDQIIIYSFRPLQWRASTSNSWSAIIIRPPKGSGEDVDDDDDDGHAADGGVVLVAESIVLLTAGEALDQQDARGDHLSKGGKEIAA